MKLVKIDPPGSFCNYEALMELVRKTGARTFIEFGCGAGDVSAKLCKMGLRGVGYDFSEQAIAIASETLRQYIETGQYRLVHGDILEMDTVEQKADLGVSLMVMEHIEDDEGFLRKLAAFIRPGGHIIVGVPGRRDCWSLEDETVGHLRRYDRQDLLAVLSKAGLDHADVWSVAVPTANLLFGLSNYMVSRSNTEVEKRDKSLREQTETSGIREIPFKTVFPPVFKLILNRVTLSPLFFLQRFFYRSNLGLTMFGIAQVPLSVLAEHPENPVACS